MNWQSFAVGDAGRNTVSHQSADFAEATRKKLENITHS